MISARTKATILVVLAVLLVGLFIVVQSVVACTAGCTPGYWKQEHHFDNWTPPWTPTTAVSTTFTATVELTPNGILDLNGDGVDDDLLDALNYKGGKGFFGKARILLRAAVASLLTSAYDRAHGNVWVYTHWTEQHIIDEVNAALSGGDLEIIEWYADEFDDLNNCRGADCYLGCPLD